MPEVSIVIPAYNNEPTLEACLQSVKANKTSYQYEIIVCDAQSTDKTKEIALKYTDKVLDGKPQRINRNIGIQEAQGNIILFTDSDCLVPLNWIDTLVDNLKDYNCKNRHIIGVGGGSVPWLNNPNELEETIAITMRSPLVAFRSRNTANYRTDRSVEHNPPINSAYFKSTLLKVGGFDERPHFPEDLDLDAKLIAAGYQLYYIAGIEVKHKHKSTYRDFTRQMQGFGVKRIKANQKHHFLRRFWHYGPALLCVMLYSPLFFIPMAMAEFNSLITRSPMPNRDLTLAFYRNYGIGELKALLGRV